MNFARSKLLPLKPLVLEETIGITSTEDALSVSSPNTTEREQAACKRDQFMHNQNLNLIAIKVIFHCQCTFAFSIKSLAFCIIVCMTDFTSFAPLSSDGSVANLQLI